VLGYLLEAGGNEIELISRELPIAELAGKPQLDVPELGRRHLLGQAWSVGSGDLIRRLLRPGMLQHAQGQDHRDDRGAHAFNPAVGQDQGKQRRRIATLTLINARAPWRLSLHGKIQEVPFSACAPDHVAARGHGGR
jgi:hypothetical protein